MGNLNLMSLGVGVVTGDSTNIKTVVAVVVVSGVILAALLVAAFVRRKRK